MGTSASEHTSAVLRGASLRFFFFFSLPWGEAPLLDARIHLAALSAGEGVRKRQLAGLGAPRSARGPVRVGAAQLAFSAPPPLSPPLPRLPFPSLPRPSPLQSIRILRLQYACARSAAGRARAWARTLLPSPPPALALTAVAGSVGSRGDARTRTGFGDELETLRRGVRSIGGGVRGGGICVCLVYGVAGRGAGGGLRDRQRGRSEESGSRSVRVFSEVRVPASPGPREREEAGGRVRDRAER